MYFSQFWRLKIKVLRIWFLVRSSFWPEDRRLLAVFAHGRATDLVPSEILFLA